MQLWEPEHIRTLIPVFTLMILCAAVLRRVLRNKPDPIRMLPIRILAVILFASEVGKQALSAAQGYSLYHLPFHFCSLFIFVLPFMAFYQGKHIKTVQSITASLCVSVMLMMLIYPALIYSGDAIRGFFTDYFDFHTVFFHNIVLFEAVLIIVLLPRPETYKGHGKPVAVFMLVFCVISATMAQVLETNFNNFYSCNIPPLEDLRIALQTRIGYWMTQGAYILIVTALDIGFVQMSYRLYRLLHRVTAAREKSAV